jgi:FAD/FMN-containing dehydrogenase
MDGADESAHVVRPDDPRYRDLLRRGFNKRFSGAPDYVRLVASTEEVVAAVQQAVRDGAQIGVRSGGHCLDGLVADPAVRALIDMSLMTGVSFDRQKGAFMVEAGATTGETYRKLYLGWGVTIPAGESPDLGMGGHILGGAFGFLCREQGLAADHLYAVEVVVVDEAGTARSVVATREPSDPNHDLWWAHTGAGGGNFGIVTRYWLRSPDASGYDPSSLLPKAPTTTHALRVAWKWDDLDEAAFGRLLRSFGAWCERSSDPSSPSRQVYGLLLMHRRQFGTIEMKGFSAAGGGAVRLLDEFLAEVTHGVGAPFTREMEERSWLRFAVDPFPELFGVGKENARFKVKDAFLRRAFDDRQIAAAHDYLTRTDHDVPGGVLGVVTYGGQVNAIAPAATASVQRDCVMSMACNAGWGDPRDEAASLAWVRAFYRELFADTGGVPVPGERSGGAMINHHDADLADPALNTSGVPFSTLYYGDNYPRLQKAKARWDPRNVFRHALSIRSA